MADQSHGDGGIAGHLQYWVVKFDESNPFMQIHLDTMLVSLIVAGGMFGFALWLKGRLVEGAPTGAQNFMESVVGFIDQTVTDNFPVHNPLIAPLAFTESSVSSSGLAQTSTGCINISGGYLTCR